MNCKECKSPVPENANFCPNCGQKIELKINTNPKTANITKETSSLSKSGNAYTFILVAIIAAFVVVVLILNSNKKDKKKEPTNNISTNTLDNGNEIKVLAEKLLVDPESLSLNIEMGNQLFDVGRFKESIPYYRKALLLDPSNVAVQIDMAVCYFNIQDIDNAILEMETALKMDPNHAKGLFNMGVIFLNAGKPEEARKYWDRLSVVHPGSRESQKAQEILNSM